MNNTGTRELYRVGSLVVDVGDHLLTRDGGVVPLPPKTFDLLVSLVRRAPGAVSRQELIDTVWPHEIVNDEALTQRLMLLRRALGDDPKHPTYIASMPRWGYRVVAPVERLEAAAAAPPAGTNGEPERPLAAPARPVTPRAFRARSVAWLLVAVVAAVVATVGYLTRREAAPIDSVAILPLVVEGGDADTAAIADGIREHVTNALARVPHLRVIAASTMVRFRSARPDPLKVGRELGVGAVVTGRLVRHGTTLSVNAELVAVTDGAQLWGGSLTRSLSDIFVVQDDLAAEIVQRLQPKLPTASRELLRTRYTDDVHAYRLYLKGRYYWGTRTVGGFDDAIACFKEAIAADPTYALAYAGLADCYALLGAAEYGAQPPREALPRARAAAARALELDPSLAEAHASLGLVQRIYDWDRAAAEGSLRRAIELAPGYASAHQWYGEMLAESGRSREAEGEIRRALDLDPLSLVINADLGLLAYYEGDFDRAGGHYRALLAMEPHFVPARLGLALTLTQQRNLAGALAELDEAARLAPDEPGVLATRGFVLGRAGRGAEAQAVAGALQRLATQRYVPAYYVGGVLLGAGDLDAAFAQFAKACEERCSLLGALRVDPVFDPVRADPRFAALERCADLAP
jgi:TolB-like protein/DNA-binding winged helix-turn-helix (wHTH) protein/Tfp pilus assembly protein PilF